MGSQKTNKIFFMRNFFPHKIFNFFIIYSSCQRVEIVLKQEEFHNTPSKRVCLYFLTALQIILKVIFTYCYLSPDNQNPSFNPRPNRPKKTCKHLQKNFAKTHKNFPEKPSSSQIDLGWKVKKESDSDFVWGRPEHGSSLWFQIWVL